MWWLTIVISVVVVGVWCMLYAYHNKTSPEERLEKIKTKELRRCRRLQRKYLREIDGSWGSSGMKVFNFYDSLEEWLKNPEEE